MSNEFKPSLLKHKCLVAIVKKGMASKIVKASKKSGAEGGTMLYGRGTGIHEHARFLGIQIEPEKEVIFIVVPVEHLDNVIADVVKAGDLDKPGTGIGFVIDTKNIVGIAHLIGQGLQTGGYSGNDKELDMSAERTIHYDLVVSVVNRGNSDVVVDATKRAGAEGGTILYGRGTGIHEQAKLFSIQIEPEKELVLTLIDQEKTEQVLEAILVDAELNKPGKGIAFVIPVEKTVGINHALNRKVNEQMGGQQ